MCKFRYYERMSNETAGSKRPTHLRVVRDDRDAPRREVVPDGKRPGWRRPGREDRQPHVTPVVEHRACEWCGKVIEVRKEGRPRKFCDSTCRAAYHRDNYRSKRLRSDD